MGVESQKVEIEINGSLGSSAAEGLAHGLELVVGTGSVINKAGPNSPFSESN